MKRLRARCLDIAGEDLLAFTVYTPDDIRHEYVADVLGDDVNRVAMDALHRPVLNVHRILKLVSRLNPLGGDHQVSIHFYSYVIYIHVPTGKRTGAIISLNRESEQYLEVYSALADNAI